MRVFESTSPLFTAQGLRERAVRRRAIAAVHRIMLAVIFGTVLWVSPVAAQTAAQKADLVELAKASQNPVGDLIAVPFQFNFNTGGGLEDQAFLNMNFQPVIPFTLSEDWNVVARTIVPLNSLAGSDGSRFSGIGDIQEQVYLTLAKPRGVIWGVGPMFSFPTSTIAPLETGSWAAGPGAVVLKNTGPWVLGELFNWYFTFADTGDSTEFNYFVTQPFVNYNFGRSGWALAFAPIITYNYDGESGQKWTVPLGLGITKTTVFDGKPMSIGVQYYSNAERPTSAAGQQLRFAVSFLYPRLRK
jgi:hypothetical protein